MDRSMIRAGLEGMGVILVVALLAMPLPFAWYVVDLGHVGLFGGLVYHIRLFHPELPVANWAFFSTWSVAA